MLFSPQWVLAVFMFWRQWARKDLRPGDMTALWEMTYDGRWDDPNLVRLQRLRRRGFVDGDDDLRVTLKGRVALLLGYRS